MHDIKEGSTFQILVDNWSLGGIVEDWYERHETCDLRLRKAKTNGHTVIETKGVMFASRIVQWHPGVKVNIIEPKPCGKAQGTVANK